MTCAEAVAAVLAEHGPPVIFGYPGAHSVKLHAAIARHPRLRHVLVRHEQGAAFAADGYARASGRAGVFLTTAGPGATNALTAVAESYANSVPTVHVCCLVDRPFIGRTLGAWHEADIEAIFRPVVKWSATAREATEAGSLALKALHSAVEGRPRPTQVLLPRDLLGEPSPAPRSSPLPPAAAPDSGALAEAGRLLGACRRPLILAGGGAVSAAAAVRELALRIGAGVATTCMGKGLFPDDHPLSLGIAFSDAAVTALREADVCLAVGCRFTQIATRDWSVRPPADLIHLDIDATVIDLHFPARVPLVADARVALEALSGQLPNPCPPERAEWAARVRELRRRDRVADSPEAAFCGLLRRAIPPEAVVVGDVASMVYHMFRHFDAYEPASFLYPSGYIAMGYGLPASIGSQLARPGACVVCIAGDGSLAMSLAELATAAQESCPLKIILLNNGCLGSIAHFAGGELPDLRSVVRLRNPDFVGLARSFGIPATQVDGADPGVTEQAVSRLTQQEGIGLVEVRLPSLA